MHDVSLYASLEPMTIDEIDLDTVETILVRMRAMDDVVAFTKISQNSIAVAHGTTYVDRRESFASFIDDVCDNNTQDDIIELDIVRWRDFDRTWHIHTGPVERHLTNGDKVHYNNTEDEYIVSQIITDSFNQIQAFIINPTHPNIAGFWTRLSELRYIDAPDIEVIP